MGRRRRSREEALQILYAIDIAHAPVHQVLEDFLREREEPLDPFTEYLVYETNRQREEIDKVLEEHMTNWHVDRLSVIDRNILRLGIAEIMCCEDVPTKVTINEYIEIAKKYGDEDSPGFVNGVIDKAAQDREHISTRKRLSK
ncbi:MAG: transcription antitermination factor NusB [Candidatus Sumerlaeia bacterium]|nr:transcription antitermination factor NusB [Candidatus Sumerlaeia bacterium]